MNIKKITILALLTAVALIIHIAEAYIPLPVAIPGVKPGLANIVTLFMLFMPPGRFMPEKFTIPQVLAVLIARILLASLIAGRPVMLLYSLAGGLFALSAQILTRRVVTDKQAWVCGVSGGVFHNIGQISMAMLITGTPAIITYLPVLIIAGIITGAITGLAAGYTALRLEDSK